MGSNVPPNNATRRSRDTSPGIACPFDGFTLNGSPLDGKPRGAPRRPFPAHLHQHPRVLLPAALWEPAGLARPPSRELIAGLPRPKRRILREIPGLLKRRILEVFPGG